MMKSTLMPITSKIIEVSIPRNQVKRFPLNNLSLMTVSGAKGKLIDYLKNWWKKIMEVPVPS
jgi:hypothetical protein